MTNLLKSIILALCLVSIAACDTTTSEDHTAKAEQYLNEGEYQAAIIELKNALQKDGNSARARWLLGKLHLMAGNPASAEKELSRAAGLGWPASDTTPELAKALLALGEYDAVAALEPEGLEPEAQASLFAAQSIALLAQGDLEAARERGSVALAVAPDNIDVLLMQARLLFAEGKVDESLVVLDRLLTSRPDSALAWSLKGDALIRQNKLMEALAAYEQSITLSPGNIADRLKRGIIHLRQQDYAAAQEEADALLKMAPRHPAGNYLGGLVYFQDQNYTEAINSLTQVDPAFDAFPMALFYLGTAHFLEGNFDQAAEFANRFVRTVPDNIAGRKLLATIRLREGDYEAVQELLQPVLDDNPEDVDALNLMANAALRSGETDRGITLLATIARLQPDSPAAQIRLGAGLLLSGQDNKAQQHIETALRLDPEFHQADILLVMNYLNRGDFDSAIAAAEDYRDRQSGDVTPHNLLGRVYLAAGRENEAREEFNQALALDAGDPAAHHQLAQLAVQQGDFAAARAHYETTLKYHEQFLPALLQLASLDMRDGNEAAIVSHLEQAIVAQPKVLEPRLMLARYYLDSGKANRVKAVFSGLDDLQMQSPQVLRLTALAQLAENQNDDAQLTLENLINAAPGSAADHHLLAIAAASAGDEKRAGEELKRALELDPNFVPSLVALAQAALARNSPDELNVYLERLVEVAPDAPEVLPLRAAAAHRQGDNAAAIEFARTAFEAAPASKSVSELGFYLLAVGERVQARKILTDWLAEHPQDIRARIILANDQQLNEEVSEAKAQYETILLYNPDNPVALNNLAWHLQKEDASQALIYARQAHSAAPDTAEILDTLGVLEYLNGNSRLGLRYVQRALEIAPDDPSMLYHSAMIQAGAGEKQGAIATLQHLASLKVTGYPEQAEAEALLARLKL